MSIYEFGDEQIVIDQITDTSCTVDHIEDSWQDLKTFRDQVKSLLFCEPTMVTDEDVITKFKDVCKTNNRIHDFWVKVATLTDVDLSLEDLSLIDKNMIAEIERLKVDNTAYRLFHDRLKASLNVDHDTHVFTEIKRLQQVEDDDDVVIARLVGE